MTIATRLFGWASAGDSASKELPFNARSGNAAQQKYFTGFHQFSEEYHSDVFLDMQSQQIIREQKQKYNMKSTHPLLRSPGILKSFQLVQCKQLWRLGCTVCTVVSKNQQFVKTLWRFNQCYMPRRSSRPKRILTLSEVT